MKILHCFFKLFFLSYVTFLLGFFIAQAKADEEPFEVIDLEQSLPTSNYEILSLNNNDVLLARSKDTESSVRNLSLYDIKNQTLTQIAINAENLESEEIRRALNNPGNWKLNQSGYIAWVSYSVEAAGKIFLLSPNGEVNIISSSSRFYKMLSMNDSNQIIGTWDSKSENYYQGGFVFEPETGLKHFSLKLSATKVIQSFISISNKKNNTTTILSVYDDIFYRGAVFDIQNAQIVKSSLKAFPLLTFFKPLDLNQNGNILVANYTYEGTSPHETNPRLDFYSLYNPISTTNKKIPFAPALFPSIDLLRTRYNQWQNYISIDDSLNSVGNSYINYENIYEVRPIYYDAEENLSDHIECQIPNNMDNLEFNGVDRNDINNSNSILVRAIKRDSSFNASGSKFLLIKRGGTGQIIPRKYCSKTRVVIPGRCDAYFNNHLSGPEQVLKIPKNSTCTVKAWARDYLGNKVPNSLFLLQELRSPKNSVNPWLTLASSRSRSNGNVQFEKRLSNNKAYRVVGPINHETLHPDVMWIFMKNGPRY